MDIREPDIEGDQHATLTLEDAGESGIRRSLKTLVPDRLDVVTRPAQHDRRVRVQVLVELEAHGSSHFAG